MFISANLDASNPTTPAPDTPNLYSSTSGISTPDSPTADTFKSGLLTTDEYQPLILPAGLNDVTTYAFSSPEGQINNGGDSTDNSNAAGLTDPFEIGQGGPQVMHYRPPPEIDPADKPRFNTPNCDRQLSPDKTHIMYLSCCNRDRTICVYFKFRHPLCDLSEKWPAPFHQIQCCSNIPDEDGPGYDCRNANNPFRVSIPAMNTPLGPTPEIKFKVNLPETPVEPVRGVKIGPVEIPPGVVP